MQRLFLLIFYLGLFINIISAQKGNFIRGIIKDYETQEPIKDAIIYIQTDTRTIEAMTLSDSLGRFSLNNVIPEKIYIKAKKLGYQEFMAGKLPFKSDTMKFNISLEALPFEMESITVVGEKIDDIIEGKGFYERKANRKGVFLEETDIRKTALSFRDILKSIPGITIDKYNIASTRGELAVYINGARVRTSMMKTPGALDTGVDVTLPNAQKILLEQELLLDTVLSIPPDAIRAIEFYNSMLNVPSQYIPPNHKGGALLVWLK